MLIDERKNGNEEYHRTSIRNKRNFWEDIANEINRVNNTNYFTGEDCNKKFLALTRAYYTTVAYKKAKAEAESLLLSTNEGSGVEGPPTTVVTKKKKRSLIGEHYYEEFSTEFWKEPGSQRNLRNPSSSSNTPNRLQPSRIPRSMSSSALGSSIASRTGTASKIPRAIPSNTSRPTTPSSGSRPVTPSFSQSAETINVFINYIEPDYQE
ncbi:hypothetical protein GLOIN_2v1776326 [Rhizophagus irregularis DAOM 181602=DAOM 197198]|nr:hypothetical protein GLOIN_2v1776326 [Rhizophagus irregularis DAOM 181602=DAOM 197198]